MKFKELPPLGEQLEGGIFAGLTTQKDGTHCAVVRLPGVGSNLNWSDAKAWAAAQGGELPSLSGGALLFETVRDILSPEWHWTSDEIGTSYAWRCNFLSGSQLYCHKSDEGSVVAVRLIPVEA